MARIMKVPLLDLVNQYEDIQQELNDALLNVLKHQRGILGPEVQLLEQEISAFCQSRFAVSVASGTDALLLSLQALGIGPHSGVITTPFTFFATVSSVVRLGARPFLCDIDPKTYNLDPNAVESFLKRECARDKNKTIHKKTRKVIAAMIPVHLYGQSADMKAFQKIANEWNIALVEDACQAIGATFEGQQAGTWGEFGALSFYPSKNLGSLGDGGMVLTQHKDLADKVRILRVHGSDPKYHHKWVGINSRLDTLQAALLLVKLKYLGRWTKKRQQHAQFYDEKFQNIEEVKAPVIDSRAVSVFNQYVVRVKNRSQLIAHLDERGIGTEIYYPVPLHLQECFVDLEYKKGDFPHAEKAAHEVLALPIYPELTDEQKTLVVEEVKSFSLKKTVVR